MRTALLVLLVALTSALAFANNPGGHAVKYTWQDGGCVNCTYNYYLSTAPNPCGAGKTPVVTGIATLAYEDDTIVAGQTYWAGFTAVSPTTGESTCSNVVTYTVPSSNSPAPQVTGDVVN